MWGWLRFKFGVATNLKLSGKRKLETKSEKLSGKRKLETKSEKLSGKRKLKIKSD